MIHISKDELDKIDIKLISTEFIKKKDSRIATFELLILSICLLWFIYCYCLTSFFSMLPFITRWNQLPSPLNNAYIKPPSIANQQFLFTTNSNIFVKTFHPQGKKTKISQFVDFSRSNGHYVETAAWENFGRNTIPVVLLGKN